MKLYHGTYIENAESIREQGLLSRFEGVYLTDSLESAVRWVGIRMAAKEQNTMAVIEVDIDETNLEEGMDHSPMMVELFGVGKSLVSIDPIPPEKITDIHYIQFGRK